MKNNHVAYDLIIYLIILFLGYMGGGFLLAAYNVNQFILIVTSIITLRLAQTGTSSISLAIAWLAMWFWGGVFVWVKPKFIGEVNPQTVAFFFLFCWVLSVCMVFLLAFANKRMYKLGLNRRNTTYGLTIIVWGAMILGWNLYKWTLVY